MLELLNIITLDTYASTKMLLTGRGIKCSEHCKFDKQLLSKDIDSEY